jgi:hypothetical protein
MSTETIDDPRRAGRKLPYAPWMTRWVLWVGQGGSMHVATSVAVVGRGVVSRLACGRGGGALWLEQSTWFWIRGHHPRLCRRCVRALAAAGESGPISRPVDDERETR